MECRIAKKRHDNDEIEVVPVLVGDPGKDECAWLMALQRVPPGEKSWAEVLREFREHDFALTPIRDGIKAVVERARKRRKQGTRQELELCPETARLKLGKSFALKPNTSHTLV